MTFSSSLPPPPSRLLSINNYWAYQWIVSLPSSGASWGIASYPSARIRWHLYELIGYLSFFWLKSCCIGLGIRSFHEPASYVHVHHHHDQPFQPGGSLMPFANVRGLFLQTFFKTVFMGSLNGTCVQIWLTVKFCVLNQMLEYLTHWSRVKVPDF